MTESRLRATIAALALTGIGIAAYLTYARYSGTQIACSTGGCETVQHSRYAVVGGALMSCIIFAPSRPGTDAPTERSSEVEAQLVRSSPWLR